MDQEWIRKWIRKWIRNPEIYGEWPGNRRAWDQMGSDGIGAALPDVGTQ